MVMPRTIVPLEVFFEGENKIPWTILFGIDSKFTPLFWDLSNMLDY